MQRTPGGYVLRLTPGMTGRLEDGRATHREVVLAPRLVVRGTTGPPPEAVAYPRGGTAGTAR